MTEPQNAAAPQFSQQLISIADIDSLCEESSEYVVDGFILEKSVNIAVGDSGLGKSPLFYQLALAVATGTPWLGHKTKQGRVLFFDYENGLAEIKELRDRLCLHMKIKPPRDLYIFTGHDEFKPTMLDELRPTLVIADPLRLFNPNAETDNSSAGALFALLKDTAKKYDTSFQIIHHLRKPSIDHTPTPLKDAVVLDWLQQASGPRAFINHSDVRMGIDAVRGKPEEAALILKKYRRMEGEGSPIYLKRLLDEHGNPLGYDPLFGVELLASKEQQEKYLLLPPEFTYTEAKRITNSSSDNAISRLLKACIASGLVEKRNSTYVKIV